MNPIVLKRYSPLALVWMAALILSSGASPLAAQEMLPENPGEAVKQPPGDFAPRFGQHRKYPPKRDQRPAGGKEGRRERLGMVKMWKLTEFLDLSEEQADKLFPRIRSLQKSMEELDDRRGELFKEFHRLIEDETVASKDIDKFLNELSKLEKSRIDLTIEHAQKLKDILTDQQRAKYAIFEERFKARLRDELIEGYRGPGER